MTKVSVHIVTHHSLIFIDPLLLSLSHQTTQDFSLLVIDNASSDGIEAHMKARWPTVPFIKNRTNTGYAHAHNQAIQFTHSAYILALNADVILHERFLEALVRAVEQDSRLGSVSGKLLRAHGDPRELAKETFSTVIDSAGVIGDRKGYYHDRGAGEEDHGQYDSATDIVGPSGAAAMYRREALENVAFTHTSNFAQHENKEHGVQREYFDELFDSYKEDVDLALRLQRYGWKSAFVPTAKAYHYRRMGGEKDFFKTTVRQYTARPARIVFLSYRNHLFTLIKHFSLRKQWRDVPWIFTWELGKIAFLMFAKPSALVRAWKDVARQWRLLREKKRQIYRSKE